MSGKGVVVSWRRLCCALGMALLCVTANAASSDGLFAKVAGEEITRAEYETAVSVATRQRFYHGRIDGERLKTLRNQVAGELIDRVLLRQEVMRRGLKVDAAAVDKRVAHDLGRYRLDGLSQEQRQHLEKMLRAQVEEQLQREMLEQQVKALPEPSEVDVRSYYKAHIDKFTTPPQLRLSLILLKVEPSSPAASWKAAQDEALRLKRKLEAGADFGDEARLHSGDASAERGGDLGFVHQGMLAEDAQKAVDALKVGEVSPPVSLLQGIALFKLLERKPEVMNPFDKVQARAKGLLQRELSEVAWGHLLQTLRSKAQFEIYDKDITITTIWADVPGAK